jgi:paraquat-inducible protein A
MGAKQMKPLSVTAREASMVSCHSCHLLCGAPSPKDTRETLCPRCGASLYQRKPNSIARTWALVLAALMFYIPANVLPITMTTSMGKVQADTIMSGVIYFMVSGSWHIALVILIASICVPLLKILALSFLLISVHRKSDWRPRDRTRLYRITEAVGRWSMLDIFVITILVALVKLRSLATIEAGPAAVFFAAVVVITMFAAMSFDPRLIWDERKQRDE